VAQFHGWLRTATVEIPVNTPFHFDLAYAADSNTNIKFQNMAQLPPPTCYSGYRSENLMSAAVAALFVFLGRTYVYQKPIFGGRILGVSEETLPSEPSYADLHNKHRGELAELAFMRKAASRGYAVSKPWGDCERYDFVVRAGKVFWRVQVKSVRSKKPQRPHYCVKTADSHKSPYSTDDIDFLVAYIFPEDAWYVFPATVVENRTALYINPTSKRSRHKQFREAWTLMEQVGTCQTCPPPETITV